MSERYSGDLPDWGGRDRAEGGYGFGDGPDGRASDPYGMSDPYASNDPYAPNDSYAPSDPYASNDPYAPSGPSSRHDPYAAPAAHPGPGSSGNDPMDADGFAPVFGEVPDHAVGYGPAGPAGHPVHYGRPDGPRESSGTAIAGFVLGLLAVTVCGGFTAPFGLVFSALGMKETGPAAPAPKDGRGLAIAGLVTSLIGLIPLLVVVLYIVLAIVAASLS